MTTFFDANRHLFVFHSREDAVQAAKSFPLTVGVHVGCGVPATRTTPEVTSLEIAKARSFELAKAHGVPVIMLPSGSTFSILEDDVVEVGMDRNVCFLTKIHSGYGWDAWVVRGATYEAFKIPLAEYFWAH